MWDSIGRWWCKTMHTQALWPIHGRYLCTRCLREHKVEWENPIWADQRASRPDPERSLRVPSRVAVTR